MQYGYMRHYSAEIARRTGESTGNITKYYYGQLPLGDNFLKKFKSAFRVDLKRLSKEVEGTNRPLASNKGIIQPKADPTSMPPGNGSITQIVSESTQENTTIEERLTGIEEAIKEIAAAVSILTQKIDARSKPPRKKK